MAYKESNIPQIIFYSAIKSEFLRIARSTLCFRDFIPKAKELLERMKQGSKCDATGTSLKKIILAHPESSQYYSNSCQHLLKPPSLKIYIYIYTLVLMKQNNVSWNY